MRSAIQDKNKTEVERILSTISDEEQLSKYINQKIGESEETLLHIAGSSDAECLKYLVEIGGDVESKDKDGRTPLHSAVFDGNRASVKYLAGPACADVNCRDKNGDTPLHIASEKGRLQCLKHLHSKGANVDGINNSGQTPLHLAAWRGRLSCVQQLVSDGAAVQSVDKGGATPMHSAAGTGQPEVVRYLSENGADVNAVNYGGDTSLHRAVIRYKVPTVESLLNIRKCNVGIENKDGQTAKQIAIAEGFSRIVEMFDAHVGTSVR